MSRAIMGSDLFEPVNGAEAKREEREAAEKEKECHGRVFAVPLAQRVPSTCELGRNLRPTRGASGGPCAPMDVSTLPKWKGHLQEWKRSEVPALHLRIQRGEADAKQLGGEGLVATGMGQHAADVLAFHVF